MSIFQQKIRTLKKKKTGKSDPYMGAGVETAWRERAQVSDFVSKYWYV